MKIFRFTINWILIFTIVPIIIPFALAITSFKERKKDYRDKVYYGDEWLWEKLFK